MKNYGYKLYEENEYRITYCKDNFRDSYDIKFYLLDKKIMPIINYHGCSGDEVLPLTYDEIRAINAKVKELGWEE